MTVTYQPNIASIGGRFQIDGEFLDATPCGSGHINKGYAGRYRTANGIVRYLHQQINHNIFKDIPKLMENIKPLSIQAHSSPVMDTRPIPKNAVKRKTTSSITGTCHSSLFVCPV